MKQNLINIALFLVLILWSNHSHTQDVKFRNSGYLFFASNDSSKAQSVYIPDVNFKTYLIEHPLINTNWDTAIQVSEAIAYTGEINVNGKLITNLKGIEAFPSISILYCCGNNISSLDISNNVALKELYCCYNPIQHLDVSAHTALTILNCENNQLTSLDVSNNIALTDLNCSRNLHLTNLNISNNTALTHLNCHFNKLTSLDISANTALVQLYCHINQLTNLDVRHNLFLNDLQCGWNQLTSLDVSANTALKILYCNENLFKSINIKNNLALTHFSCTHSQLTHLDLSANTALKYVLCYFNQLDTLDISNNKNLIYLLCNNNKITNLDVSTHPYLEHLNCQFNQLRSLDVSNNPVLKMLNCQSNQLTSLNIKNGKNKLLTTHNFTDNPNLSCIEVDDISCANADFTNKDEHTSYSNNCFLDVQNIAAQTIHLYPSPVASHLNIETEETILSKEIIDASGRVVLVENDAKNSVEVGSLGAGVYIIRLSTERRVYQERFVKG